MTMSLGFESFAGKSRDARSQKLWRDKQSSDANKAKKETLKQRYPELARRWHPTKNLGKKSAYVKADSVFACWWKCPRGPDHEWSMTIRAFAAKGGDYCPCCLNLQVSRTNNLATIAPEIAAQWHPTKNREDVSPAQTLATADVSAWWKCPVADDHVWSESVRARTARYLARKRKEKEEEAAAKKKNNNRGGTKGGMLALPLSVATTTANPMAAIEGDDAAATTAATPDDEGKENSRPAIGTAEVGSSSSAADSSSSSSSSSSGSGGSNALRSGGACPCCMGLKVSSTNCVETVAPLVAAMWHPKRNKVRGVHAGDTAMRRLRPHKVVAGSVQLCWLNCHPSDGVGGKGGVVKGHDFCVPINEACARAASGLPNAQVPCPECAREVVKKVLRSAINAAVEESELKRLHGARSKWFKAGKEVGKQRKRGGKGGGAGGAAGEEQEGEEGEEVDAGGEAAAGSAAPDEDAKRGWLSAMRSKVFGPLQDAVAKRRSRTSSSSSSSSNSSSSDGGGGGGGGGGSKPPTKSPIKSPTKMLARLLGGTGGGSDAVEAAAAVEGNAKQPGREEQVGGGDEEEVEGGEEEEEEGDEEEEEEPSSAEEESTDDSDREATPAVSLIDDDKEEVEPAAPAARTTTKSQACAIS